MNEQLTNIINRYNDLKAQMMEEAVYSDLQRTREVNKELSDLEESYHISVALKQALSERDEANELIATESDSDLLEMAQEQLSESNKKITELEEAFKYALLPRDPNDDKDIFLEIRPAAGGDEAGLFASELFKCYMLYAQKQGRRTEIMDEQLTDIG